MKMDVLILTALAIAANSIAGEAMKPAVMENMSFLGRWDHRASGSCASAPNALVKFNADAKSVTFDLEGYSRWRFDVDGKPVTLFETNGRVVKKIAKLPFPNPSDPLVAGIAAEMKERGENTFKDFFVPEAYMEMRQGLGRLLRSEEDSGKVLILDNRIVKESYGKTFARIWNFKHVQANNVSDIQNFLK